MMHAQCLNILMAVRAVEPKAGLCCRTYSECKAAVWDKAPLAGRTLRAAFKEHFGNVTDHKQWIEQGQADMQRKHAVVEGLLDALRNVEGRDFIGIPPVYTHAAAVANRWSPSPNPPTTPSSKEPIPAAAFKQPTNEGFNSVLPAQRQPSNQGSADLGFHEENMRFNPATQSYEDAYPQAACAQPSQAHVMPQQPQQGQGIFASQGQPYYSQQVSSCPSHVTNGICKPVMDILASTVCACSAALNFCPCLYTTQLLFKQGCLLRYWHI